MTDTPAFLPRAGRAAEAAMWLLLAWLALRFLPFRRVMVLFRPTVGTEPEDADSPAQVVRAVRAAARRVPWPAVCFPQGIAAQRMLCRRGIAADLHYGIARSSTGTALEAHVWVTVAGKTVIGDLDDDRFTRIATFSPARRKGR